MKARFVKKIGLVALGEHNITCLKSPQDLDNTKRQSRHEQVFLGETDYDKVFDAKCVCDNCKEEFVADTAGSHYDTSTGELEPGCLYWDDSLPENYFWDNHTGPHLMSILPNGDHWNIDSRANNCGSPEDKLHRCWVRTGDPETGLIDVGKNGHTCNAGAGSIQSGDYHGYLHNGEFHT